MQRRDKEMITPIIETARLKLRPLSIQDAELIFNNWTSDDRVSKYVRWTTHQNINETTAWLNMEAQNLESDKAYQWGFELKESKYLIGSGGINYSETEKVFELGYNIMHRYWNLGYTTEAANAILNFAINELKENTFIAWHALENPASGRVLEKCGFLYEKIGQITKFDGITTYESKMYRLKV
jgi:Acetyltransferases, including N-acetylases of ribosomal proteins